MLSKNGKIILIIIAGFITTFTIVYIKISYGIPSTSTPPIKSKQPIITPTFKITSTASITATPTETVTQTPTSTPTPQPTPSPTITKTIIPTSAILFSDNFEIGNGDKWKSSQGKWTVKKDENGNNVFEGTGPNNYPQTWLGSLGDQWRDYAFESKIRIIKGGVFVLVRAYQSNNFYNAYLPAGGTISLAKWENGKYYNVYSNTSFYIDSNIWYLVRVEIIGQTYKLYINDELVTSYTHDAQSPIIQGGIGYYIGGNDIVQVDDVKVWKLTK
jgi:hypothetical protein